MGSHIGTRARPVLEDLLGPALPGAACAGHAPQFDAEIDGESPRQRRARIASAAAVCHQCPAQSRCDRIAHHIPASGVWAAELRLLRSRRIR
jgi:WhiB family redox-sensing transcriptional regulator